MIVNSLDEYIEIVAGHVCDNDKIVTYKWLSKELEVHVNLAKQILWEFIQRHQKEGNIQCTYLLMGTLTDGGLHVEVVKDVELENAKKKFSKISAEHIYSLQKSLPDIELLAISGEGDVRFSGIKCNESIKRTDEEMDVLRWGSVASNRMPIAPVQISKAEPTAKAKTPPESSKEKSTPFNKNTAAQKKGFNNLFGKASTKEKSPGTKTDASAKATSNKAQTSPRQGTSASPKKKVQKGGINAFFEQAKKEDTKSKDNGLLRKAEDNDVIVEKKKEKEEKEEKEEEKEIQVDSSTKKSSKKQPRGKKRNRSKDTNGLLSKRKRIMVLSESSDSENSCEDEVEEVEASPQRRSPVKNRTPSPPPVKIEGGKRKVLKMVDKIFKEDDFYVTKKVHVYESCSEDEPEMTAEVKKPSPAASRSEAKTKKNTKQTTLNSFFKKS